VRSGDARIRQAGLRPNPELTVDLENFLGSDPSRKFETLETTLSISQLMELGGKRAARIRLASSEKEVSIWDYEAKRADVAAEMEQRKAGLTQERANRIPDVTISGGVRRSREANVTSFVFGAAVPLPLFHRNQGKILESQYRISKAEREREAAGNKVLAALSDAYQALATGYAEATTLKSAVIPGAQSAFEATSEGFRQGKFGYLEVLDAQRTLFEARGRYVESLGAYHKAVADTERLIGGELGEPVKSIGTK
jgi:cobalt-zinc-cadmium efflux system outer membrane protein